MSIVRRLIAHFLNLGKQPNSRHLLGHFPDAFQLLL